MITLPTLPEQLKAARHARGWTQVQAARRAKVDSNTWARWEQGRARPEWSLLERVAKILGRRLVVTLAERSRKSGKAAKVDNSATPAARRIAFR